MAIPLLGLQNPHTTFRQLMLESDYSPEDAWNVLRYLQETKVIESVKISNRRSGWKVQHAYDNKKS